MNAPKRIKIRIPFTVVGHFVISDIIPLFHRWIQNQTVSGTLIDVADYKHVENGPGIMLIGHEGDLGIEFRNGNWSLYYDRKHETGETLAESIDLLRNHIRNAQDALTTDEALAGQLTFTEDGFEITLLDRLAYPNQPEQIDAVGQIISEQLETDTSIGAFTLTAGSTAAGSIDRRWPLTIHITLAQPEGSKNAKAEVVNG